MHGLLTAVAVVSAVLIAARTVIMLLNRRTNIKADRMLRRNGLIGDQHGATGRAYMFGVAKARGTSCEAIAIYNALRLTGKEVPLSRVITRIQLLCGDMAFGLLGTDPFAIGRVLRSFGADCRRSMEEETESEGVYIISFWNSSRIQDGLHTVCCLNDGTRSHTFNLDCSGGVYRGSISSLGKRIICVYSLGKAAEGMSVHIPSTDPPVARENVPLEK